MMKAVTKEKFLTEANHGARYQRQVGKRSSNLKARYKEGYKNRQLAQEEDQTENPRLTLTKQQPNNVNVDVKQGETHIKPIQGPKV